MPELPEVERGRRIAERALAGKTLTQVLCAEDEIVFQGLPPDEFERALRGRRVESVHRRGKQLWFRMDRGPHPLFHFGMTGAFCVPEGEHLPLATGPREADANWPPRFWKIRLRADDGSELAMTNARRLGRILLRENPEGEAPISKLGFDPLLDLPDAADFETRLRRRKTPIKALLLNQSFCAGVGNWIADEICYQARIDPRRRANDLNPDEIRRLRRKLAAIIQKAVSVDADKNRLPKSWLFHHRWGKQTGARTAAGEAIEHLEIGGRTTAWVPSLQS
jgi:formamidopyrimidine-DNA glycosylase